MKHDEWLPVSQLSRLAGVPEASARRYVQNFPEFFQARKGTRGKVILYSADEGARTLKRISECFAQGHGRDGVLDTLDREGFNKAIDVEGGNGDGFASGEGMVQPSYYHDLPALIKAEVGVALSEAVKIIADQRERIEHLETRIKALEAHNRTTTRDQTTGLARLWDVLTRPRGVRART